MPFTPYAYPSAHYYCATHKYNRMDYVKSEPKDKPDSKDELEEMTAKSSASCRSVSPDPIDTFDQTPQGSRNTERVHHEYGVPSACRVVTGDGVVFYLSNRLVAQCPHLFEFFASPGVSYTLPIWSTATGLQFVLNLLQSQHMETWPALAHLGTSLRIAHHLEIWVAYKLIAGYIQSKLLFQNWGRQSWDVFALAGKVGDDLLARIAVDGMERQGDANLRQSHWSESEIQSCAHLPSMLWCPGTWTPEMFDAVPTAYVYALNRATIRTCVPYEDKSKAFGDTSLGEDFANALAVYREHERLKEIRRAVLRTQ